MNMKSFVIEKKLPYQELIVNDGVINKFYQLENGDQSSITAVPDACVDLQFVIEEGRCIPYACGSFLEGTVSPTGRYRNCFGIKFNPGVIPNCIQMNIKDIINGRSGVEVYPEMQALCEAVCQIESFEGKVKFFLKHFSYEKQIGEKNDMVEFVVTEVKKNHGCVNISDIAYDIGYNQKYLDRVFKNRIGMPLKKYAVIMRVQEAIHFLQEDMQDEVYNSLCYYDQAHFIRDFKRYTCLTPHQYVNQREEKVIV